MGCWQNYAQQPSLHPTSFSSLKSSNTSNLDTRNTKIHHTRIPDNPEETLD